MGHTDTSQIHIYPYISIYTQPGRAGRWFIRKYILVAPSVPCVCARGAFAAQVERWVPSQRPFTPPRTDGRTSRSLLGSFYTWVLSEWPQARRGNGHGRGCRGSHTRAGGEGGCAGGSGAAPTPSRAAAGNGRIRSRGSAGVAGLQGLRGWVLMHLFVHPYHSPATAPEGRGGGVHHPRGWMTITQGSPRESSTLRHLRAVSLSSYLSAWLFPQEARKK